MILKVFFLDFYKNVNLVELRCNKKKNFLYWYLVYIEYFEVYFYFFNYVLYVCC